MYEGDSGKRAPAERRYSPAACTSAQQQAITGNPDPAHIATSFVERQNLTMRMSIRRLTRLTNQESRQPQAARALYFMHYNFMRIHESHRVPAMDAGLSEHLWSREEISGLA